MSKVTPITQYLSLPDKKPKTPIILPIQKRKNLDALFIAQGELGASFDREHMKLHGRPIRLNDLMQEVNRLRLAAGRTQVIYNPLWEVKL